MELLRGQRAIPTVFHLGGENENDMTDALGYVLSRSRALTRSLLGDLTGYDGEVAGARIQLQAGSPTGGIFDVRITVPGEVDIIIEAKRDASLPTRAQLERYAPRLRAGDAQRKLLVSLSHATGPHATTQLPDRIDTIPVAHRSWRQLAVMAAGARSRERAFARHVLNEFVQYLRDSTQMDIRRSNIVYVVSVASGFREGWALSWIDIVEKRRRYFYPVGAGWPEPQNYLAFRYRGRLQSIHHVDDFETFTDPHSIFPEAKSEEWMPHYCFHLGEPIVPVHDVKAGPSVLRAARVYCMLDTLLTARTISDAMKETQRRLK